MMTCMNSCSRVGRYSSIPLASTSVGVPSKWSTNRKRYSKSTSQESAGTTVAASCHATWQGVRIQTRACATPPQCARTN
jgi:hypothetical protein